MYMDVLFHDVKLNYYVPIISQQGEVAGKLQVEEFFFSNGIIDRCGDDVTG